MIISDSLIKTYCQNNTDDNKPLIHPFDQKLLGSYSYDLTIKDIIIDGSLTKSNTHELKPNDFVFVSTTQTVNIPTTLVGFIENKTSQIRQGLEILAAPYQPGIRSRIFIKVTNTSDKIIQLKPDDEIAQIFFSKIEGEVKTPYDGSFNKEDSYTGLASYSSKYQAQQQLIKEKTKNLENLEAKLYGIVAALMAIFVAIISIITSSKASSGNSIVNILVNNLMIMGSIGFLFGVISLFIPAEFTSLKKPSITCFVLCVITFGACFLISPELTAIFHN